VPGPQSEAQHLVVDVTIAGGAELVAAVAGKAIRVLGYLLVATANVEAVFNSNDNGTTPVITPLSGPLSLVTARHVEANFNPVGWFQTLAGEALDLSLGGTGATPDGDVGGHLVYVLV